MQQPTYDEQITMKNEMKLRELLCRTSSFFVKNFFRGIEPTTSSRTRIAYAYDLKIFFHFLQEKYPDIEESDLKNWPVTVLDKVTLTQLEEYLDYLRLYEDAENKVHTNEERGRMRKTASIRTFYKFFYRKQVIKNNTASLLNLPKKHEHTIVRLEIDEIAKLLDAVEEGDNLTKSQKKYHNKTKIRDLAILTLLLGTGIRVSECVGLDLNDVDFKNNGITVTRKGGNQMVVYFGDEVALALKNYINGDRKAMTPLPGHENALFLSTQRKRMGVQAVENMVRKYAKQVTPYKKITPHKLRSTYGTSLYKETGDIYLVADVLGHKDVNTTKKHYAAIDEDRRRQAASAVKLRES